MSHSLKQDFKLLLSAPYGWLAALGIFLIPLDSTWLFPLDTVYRPAWIIPFVVIGMLRSLLSLRLLGSDVVAISISFYALLSSVFATVYFAYPDYSGLIKMLVVVLIFGFGIVGINYFLHSLSRDHSTPSSIRIVASAIVASSLLPIFIGFLQIPGELLGFHELNNVITSLFSYRYTAGRIHLLSGEPSWAARYILFVIIVSLFVDAKHVGFIRKALLVLFLFTGSALGFFTGLLLLAAYNLIHLKLDVKILFKLFLYILLLAIPLVNYDLILAFSPYAVDKIDRVLDLMSKLSLDHIMLIASVDGSILARIVNPIISFDLAMSYPLGVGGESFKFWVIGKIQEYGYAGTSSDEYILGAGSTPKFLIAKIIAEHGIMFLFFVSAIFVKLYRKMPSQNLRFLLISVPIMTLSDDSYLFYGLIIPVCIAAMVYRNSPKSNINNKIGVNVSLSNA